MQNQRAVNLSNNRGALHLSHTTFRDFLQTQLANWRSSSSYHHPHNQHHQQGLYTQPYNMNTEQDNDNDAAWVRSHASREEHGPMTSAWANVHPSHPQPEQSFGHASFFSDGMDYFPEEAALFIPPSAEPGSLPRSMEVVPATFAHQDVLKTDESTATRLLQTNVDVAQYGPVFEEDWRKASIDFADDEDAASPALTDASSQGPFTPNGYDGEYGLGEVAFSQLSRDLTSSIDSMRNDPLDGMFDDVAVDSTSTFTPWGTARACHPITTQASIGIQYGPLSSNSLGGLPMLAARSMHKPIPSDEKPTLGQGRFRDVDGLPTDTTTMPFPSLGRRRQAQLVSIAPAATAPSTSREERDRYLLDMRHQGFTYREIKDTGDFNEAESTLRGRVRVLTKAREERVRKPEWTERDVRLLRRAVAHVNRQPSGNGNRRRRTGKLPWKEVGDYITRYGGSYCFAPATCARKWEEVSRDE
jgi:hypothetical protein